MTDTVIAVDIGGTTIKCARMTIDGATERTVTVATPRGSDAIVAAIIEIVGVLRNDSTAVVGLCAPGIVHPDRGLVEYAANLGFVNTPLRELVHHATGLPTTLQHDVRAACTAEARVGYGRLHSANNIMVVVLGTGLAAGFMVDGRLVSGENGTAGEFGHIPIVPDGEACACGQHGCLEVYSSAGGLLRRYRAAGGRCGSTAEMATRIADDVRAERVWTDGTKALGRALVTATAMLDPAAIVLAGGLSRAGRILLDPVVSELEHGLSWRAAPSVNTSTLGAQAGMIGAALYALDCTGRSGDNQLWSRRVAGHRSPDPEHE